MTALHAVLYLDPALITELHTVYSTVPGSLQVEQALRALALGIPALLPL